MSRIERILAATDLSAPARHAVARAFRIAGETHAELTVLHVLSLAGLERLRQLLGSTAAGVEQRLEDEARQRLAALTAQFGTRYGCSAGVAVARGRVTSAILDEADARDAGLIVLGARGEGYLGRLLIGTTSERLLRRTLRPMLVVKQPPHEAYRRVLVPVDFSAGSAQLLRLAQAVAPGAELILFHAFEAPFESKLRYAGVTEETLGRYLIAARQEALARLQELAAEVGLTAGQVRIHVEHGEAARAILMQEVELDCDLIVLGKHGQGMMEELLLGSVTKHVLAESAGDVLVAVAPTSG
jgi:nucleotide-binding universal stress UspA family protein